jgi:CheY-like chemotaxis protein
VARTLFVVDDSATMRKVFELTFAGEDVTVITHDGAEGVVARAREVRPHAAIVDVALGGAVGYDVVRSLRADAGLATVPIYLLYSDHSPLDEAAARACGAAGALAKPFDTQAMIDRVRQAFSMTAGAPAPAASPVGNLTQPFGSPAAAAAAAALRAAPPAATAPTAPAPRPAAAPAVPPASPAARGPVVPPARPGAPPSAARAPATPTGREAELSLDDLATARAPAPAPRPIAAAPVAVPRVLQPHAPEPSPPELSRQVAHEIHAKVSHLGLTQAQVEAVTALTKEVVERVVWEVVPQLAETLIREEIKRLTAE